MAATKSKSSEVVFLPVTNYLDGSTACAVTVALKHLINQGARRILMDFSRVRNFEYFGMAILLDAITQYKKNGELRICLQGLSEECNAALQYFGFRIAQ